MSEPIESMLARKGHAAQTEAVRQLRLLPPDDALRLVARELRRSFQGQRCVELVVRRGGLILLCIAVALLATEQFRAAFFLMLALPFLPAIPLLLRAIRLPLWINGRAAALDLVGRVDSPLRCGTLLDLAIVVEEVPRGWAVVEEAHRRRKRAGLRSALDDRLVRLLPRLEPEMAALFIDEHRAHLRRMLARLRHDPDACIAILLALGTARDREAQTDARLLVINHSSERVRAAARECLLSLGESSR